MIQLRIRMSCVLFALLIAAVAPTRADEVVITPVQDGCIGTFYQSINDATCSNAGTYLFVGSTQAAGPRRALLMFDVASNVPAGATIDAVELSLFLDRAPPGGPDIDLGLHPLNADWGEGASSSDGMGEGGFLSTATPGDVTWVYRFYPDVSWTNIGGDFDATASATTTVTTTLGDFVWNTTPDLVADVQSWLDNPSTNFGWMLKRPDDDVMPATGLARRFFAREVTVASRRPRLRITFTPGTGGCSGELGDANGDGNIDGLDVQAFVECAISIAIPTLPCACADVNDDLVVDVADVAMFAQLLLAGN